MFKLKCHPRIFDLAVPLIAIALEGATLKGDTASSVHEYHAPGDGEALKRASIEGLLREVGNESLKCVDVMVS